MLLDHNTLRSNTIGGYAVLSRSVLSRTASNKGSLDQNSPPLPTQAGDQSKLQTPSLDKTLLPLTQHHFASYAIIICGLLVKWVEKIRIHCTWVLELSMPIMFCMQCFWYFCFKFTALSYYGPQQFPVHWNILMCVEYNRMEITFPCHLKIDTQKIFLAIIFIASSPYILLTEEEDDTLYTRNTNHDATLHSRRVTTTYSTQTDRKQACNL